MRALVLTAVLLGSSSLYPAFAQDEGSLSLPTRPKLSRSSRSERPSNRSNLATKSVRVPRTSGSVAVGECKSAMTSVAIGWATTRWGEPGTRPWAAIGGCVPMMTAPTEVATAEVITTRIGLAVE